MAEYNPSQCADDSLTCNNNGLTTEQLLRAVFTVNEDGCLMLRVSSSGGGGGAGDASAANQVTGNGLLSTIAAKDFATQTTLAAVLAKLNASVAVTGTFWQATQPVSAASLPLPSGAATETTLSAANAKLPATLGQKTMANSFAVTTASDQPIFTADNTLAPSSSRTVGLVATAVAVKASAGNIYGWMLYNKTGADVWVKFCNLASGSVVVGTTPVVLALLVPASGQTIITPSNAPILGFSTAISVYSVTGDLDSDNSAPTAGGVTVNILYK